MGDLPARETHAKYANLKKHTTGHRFYYSLVSCIYEEKEE
jgi:hypothetical protein